MRVDGWPEALHEVVEGARRRVFTYGSFDCCLFAADCVQAITGVDPAAALRGYATREEAYAIVARYGSMEDMIAALLGRDTIHPAFAGRGDVVLADVAVAADEAPGSVGVCMGVQSVFPGARGLMACRTLDVKTAWRVG